MRKALLVATTVALSLSTWMIWVSRQRASRLDQPLELATAQVAPDVEQPPPSERMVAPSPAPAAVQATPPADPPPVALAAPPTDPAALEEWLREKYRDATIDHLVVAGYHLHRRLLQERDRIGKEIIDAGALETTFLSAEAIAAGEKLPPMQSRPGERTSSFVFTAEHDFEGNVSHKQARIEPKDYPEYHALEVESLWVANAIRAWERTAK